MMELKTIYAVKRVDYDRDECGNMTTKNKLYSVHTKRSDAVKQMRHHARCEDDYTLDRTVVDGSMISFADKENRIKKDYMIIEDQIRI